jgi:hypothetical protein
MEVSAISYAGGSYAPSPASNVATLQAGSAAAVDLPAGENGSMSVTVASQVNMVFGQMTQGGGIDPQMLKALIMLLVLQLLMNGGQGGQGNQGLQTLSDLAQTFQDTGNSEMSMVAMQASSMIQIDFAGGQTPAMSIQAGAAASLDIMA